MKRITATLLLALVCNTRYISFAQARIIEFDNPRMKVLLPPDHMQNGKAVVACPGGGYHHLAYNHEGYHWAPFFNNLGYAYAVMEYKLPGGDRNIPLNDCRKGFKIMVDSAQVWGIHPRSIGIMGSSAGGHLASTLSTHPTEECSPAFQILFYPVISLDKDITHTGTRNGFLGDAPSERLVDEWSSDKNVTSATPPAFLVLCSDDKTVKPTNSILYYNALMKAGIPAAMHIYPTGGHGWGYRTTFTYHDLMLQELTAWLNSLTSSEP